MGLPVHTLPQAGRDGFGASAGAAPAPAGPSAAPLSPPLAPPLAAVPAPGPEGVEAPGGAPHLLIVDDIADNRLILARRFARRGFATTEAADGEAALALIASQPFDAVLLDVMMPGIDGIEVLKRIRQRFSPADLPVIMVTAKSQSQDVVIALEHMANDYVTKPVDFAVALARVNVQVARKRAEDEVRRVNDALRQSNENLEERVTERTLELVAINDQLKDEIEQRQQSEAHSRYLAYHDALTGLPNRLQFRQDLEAALAGLRQEPRPFAVLFVDLDGFKSVNDTIGHSIGDLLLQAVAGELSGLLADGDRIARLGGDEFAILQFGPPPDAPQPHAHPEADAPQTHPHAAMGLASRIITVASQPRVIEGQQLMIGASVGIVVSSDADDDPETLLKNADLAMYRAKADGRGTYRVFDPAMDALAQARRQIEIDLRRALALGQFEVHYQPLIALKAQRISGFEALMRWRHPVRGMVSPADFIPVAEEIGLIVPLGDWVLREACREAASWPAPVKIAVNVSPVQFVRGNIVATVLGALAASGLPADRLEIEITESVLLEKTDRNLQTLHQLRDLGVRISMDDFGTGYSSLGYLRRFPFDKIKIDQSFIRGLAHDRESDAIVHAITGLGLRFGIATTAEGVETAEQLKKLHLEGCTEVQGKLYSMPVPAKDIDTLLEKYGSR